MKFLKLFSAFIIMLVVVPTFAQDPLINSISFNGFSFSIDSTLATHVSITQYLSSPEDVFPEQGIHTHFLVYGEEVPNANVLGVRVYRIADLAAYEHTQLQVTQLEALLAERRDFSDDAAGTDSPLPFLPVVAAGQTIRGRAQYVETSEVTGISYITAYQQAAEPLLQDNFLYTFQGMSADGVYYVSAVFQVKPASFATQIPTDFDYQAFVDQLPAYLNEMTTQLNNAAPDAFTPSLNVLDAVAQSFAFQS